MVSILGLIGGLGLLIYLAIRGTNLLIAAPLCGLVVATSGQLPVFSPASTPDTASFLSSYMEGFAGFVKDWFPMFLLGSLFGKMMENSGAAASVSHWIVTRLGLRHALLAIVLACAVLTYGGVSLFVVAFSVYPMAVSLFREANLPRRFIPATIAFGSVTFTMTSAGSPEIQNWIPIRYLGTSPYAGWIVSLMVAIFMALLGYLWLRFMVRRARQRGERFQARESDPRDHGHALPRPVTGLISLSIVLVLAFLLHDLLAQAALVVALLGGVLAVILFNRHYFLDLRQATSDGVTGALIAIANTSAVVGFGTVARESPAFDLAVEFLTGVPGTPLLGAAIAVTSIAALTGSASGGQAIALPALAPGYLTLGVEADHLHRVVALSSGALDTLPHNGYVVTTIRAICGESHREAYAPLGALTAIIPLAGTVLAIVLFTIGW